MAFLFQCEDCIRWKRNHSLLATCDGDRVTVLRKICLQEDTASKLIVASLEIPLSTTSLLFQRMLIKWEKCGS